MWEDNGEIRVRFPVNHDGTLAREAEGSCDMTQELSERIRQCCRESDGEENFCFMEETDDGCCLVQCDRIHRYWEVTLHRLRLSDRARCREEMPFTLPGMMCEHIFSFAGVRMKDQPPCFCWTNRGMQHLLEECALLPEEVTGSAVFRSALRLERSVCGELLRPGNLTELPLMLYCVPVLRSGRVDQMLVAVWRLSREPLSAQELLNPLTPRERQIIRLAADGMTNKYIANHLHISEGTVKKNLYNSYKKLHISSRFDVIRLIGKC